MWDVGSAILNQIGSLFIALTKLISTSSELEHTLTCLAADRYPQALSLSWQTEPSSLSMKEPKSPPDLFQNRSFFSKKILIRAFEWCINILCLAKKGGQMPYQSCPTKAA